MSVYLEAVSYVEIDLLNLMIPLDCQDPENMLGDTPKDTDHIARRMALWAEREDEDDEEVCIS